MISRAIEDAENGGVKIFFFVFLLAIDSIKELLFGEAGKSSDSRSHA